MKNSTIDFANADDVEIARHLDWLIQNKTQYHVAEALRQYAKARGLTNTAQLRLDRLIKEDAA